MELIVGLEQRFLRTPDGAIRTATSLARPYWDRYLRVFDRVRVVARVSHVAEGAALPRVDGDGVVFSALPGWIGPRQYLRERGRVRAALRAVPFEGAAVLLRAPGLIANLLSREMPRGQPFGIEVVSDPAEALGTGAVRHPLRPLFRALMRRSLREQCARSAAALYVTEYALQRRYPAGAAAWGVSDVDLPDEAFVPSAAPRQRPLRLISVAMLEQPYKRIDDLLQALALLRAQGLDLPLTVVGAGGQLPLLRALAEQLGVAADFAGALPGGAAVRAALDAHDLFVLPSQTEGLPRALVEAMARGLPCVATRVGGVPELLGPEGLVPPREPEELARRIARFARDPALRARAGAENLARARDFAARALQPRREEFLRKLWDATASSLDARAAAGSREAA